MKFHIAILCTFFTCHFVFSQNFQFGTTIITHGFQDGLAPITENEWAYEMAEAILTRVNNKGCICTYIKTSGIFEKTKGDCKSGEIILLFDWAEESRIDVQGYSEAAGDALFAALIMGAQKGDFGLERMHFIGHSRGTVVNTLAVERLLVLKKKYPQLYASVSIDQVTNIDPHDWGFAGKFSDLNDAHPEINIDIPTDRDHNNGAIAWKGVFSDTYWQDNLTSYLSGRSVEGTMDFHWNQNDLGEDLDHFGEKGIHQLGYTRTIAQKVKIDGGGYHLSRLGGESHLRSNAFYGAVYPTFGFYSRNRNGRIIGFMNGSFDRGNGDTGASIHIPGWEEHGGRIKNIGYKFPNSITLSIGHLVNAKDEAFLEHNRQYLPPDVKSIRFRLKGTVGIRTDKPVFRVILKDLINNSSTILFDEEIEKTFSNFQSKKLDISNYGDRVVQIRFEFSFSRPTSSPLELTIDEIELSTIPTNRDNTSTLFLFDLSGSMNHPGQGASKTKLEEAKDASKQTLNALRNDASASSIGHEVGVLGFSGECAEDPTRVISKFETDLSLVEERINDMSAGGGTPLAKAIAAAECRLADHLAKNGQQKGKLIILSDGQATCQKIRPEGIYNSGQLGQKTITVSAGQCSNGSPQSANIKYYTIGFNIAPGSPAERDLQYLAQVSGGKYLNAQSQVQLERAFRKFNRVYIPKEAPSQPSLPSASIDQFSKGLTEIKSESFEPALDVYTAFVKQHGNDCNGIYNLALMQEANDLYQDAIANYRKYLSLCPGASDTIQVEGHIATLEEEYLEFLAFQKEVVESDLAYLQLHFEKIQNGESLALAAEFKGFLQEKGDFYHRLPEMMGRADRLFKTNTKEVANGLENCAAVIRRNPNTWDRDATPALSMAYLNLKRLIGSF